MNEPQTVEEYLAQKGNHKTLPGILVRKSSEQPHIELEWRDSHYNVVIRGDTSEEVIQALRNFRVKIANYARIATGLGG